MEALKESLWPFVLVVCQDFTFRTGKSLTGRIRDGFLESEMLTYHFPEEMNMPNTYCA